MTRIDILNLRSLEERRIINDIFVFTIIKKLVHFPFDKYISFNTNNTRSQSLKLNVNRFRVECRKTLVLGVLVYRIISRTRV